MLETVKKALRISHNELDSEIEGLIASCKAEMLIKGIKTYQDTDPLIRQAIIVYCKSEFGLSNADSKKYRMSFDSLVISLALCGEYSV